MRSADVAGEAMRDSVNYLTTDLRRAFKVAEERRVAREQHETRMMALAGFLLFAATLGLIALANHIFTVPH
jgi:hypothetical protein